MAKKQADQSNKAGRESARSGDKLTSTVMIGSAISLVVAVACFCFLALFERPAINRDNLATQAQSFASSQATLIDQAISQLRRRMAHIAGAEPLLKALDSGDKKEIARLEIELGRAFPEAMTAKLVVLGPLGIASVDKQKYALRNNIELDLLRYASNGEQVQPEAYQFDGKWLFSLAEPIKGADAKAASGALLITLDQNYLRELFSQSDGSLGETTLIQQFANKQTAIVKVGNPGASEQSASADATISHWQVVFTPSRELVANSAHNATHIWILLAIAAIAIVAAAAYILSGLQKLLAHDLEKLEKGSQTGFSLHGFDQAAAQIHKQLATAAKAAADAKARSAEAAKAAGAAEPEARAADTDTGKQELPADIPATIFRAYDIRGLADQELNDNNVYAIGLAIGSEALDQGQQTLVVGADGRHSSPRIKEALIKGLLASGRDVIDIGMVPTPLMYFATHELGTQSGVMVTGSHNPPEYNGLKIVIGGRALSGAAIESLRARILSKSLTSGKGQKQSQAIEQSYIDYIINDVAIAQPLKVVIDAGNGVAGAIAPRLFEELGCETIQLYCEVDGDFPHHHPDPTVEANLADLKQVVAQQQADLGIAFDGDGDRLGVVTASGKSVPADRLLMLLAQDVVSRNPGADILFDVKCTRNLNTLISNYGGRPIMWKTGHSFMKDKMIETGALLGGEFSGHIFFKERWFGFDDGMYAAARLIEILSTTDPDLDLQLQAFPESVGSPELKVDTTEEGKFQIIDQLIERGQFDDGKISTLDGVRVDFSDGWGLVRASNTTPCLILRFEADDAETLARIQALFKEQLLSVDPGLQFGF